MATVDWFVVCDMAYFDAADRLCVFGAETNEIRVLPAGTHRLAFVVRLTDREPQDNLRPALFVTSPSGEMRAADDVADFSVESRGECVIVHMPSLRVDEEGTYRFELALGTSAPVMVELRVLVAARRSVRLHRHGAR